MLISCLRTLLMYLVLIWALRLSGKRQIGQLEPAEFVVTMLIANLAGIPMEDPDIPLLAGVVPILTLLAGELILTWLTVGSLRLRRLLCGKPVILIDNGVLLTDNLLRTRLTVDELTGRLRQKDVLSIRDVQFAVLETNGQLSVFPWPDTRPPSAREAGVKTEQQNLPVTLVEEGKLNADNLPRAGKSRAWVQARLREHGVSLRQTLLLTVDAGGTVVWIGKEQKP